MDGLHAFLAAIVESSDDAIIGLSPGGRIISWNRGARQIYGYLPEEVIGQPISLLSLPERTDELLQMQGSLLSGRPIHHLRTIHLDSQGRSHYVSLTLSPVHNQQGELLGASVVVRDITRQLRAEEALRDAEEKYRQLFCAEQDAILLIDDDSGAICDANQAALELYGGSLQELLQLHLSDLLSDPLAEADGTRFTSRHQRLNGETFAAEVSLGRFKHRGQQFQVMIVRDISGRIRAERLHQELLLTREFQQRLLPAEIPQLPGYEIHAASHYCREAGGDYYDFFLPESQNADCLGFAVGDVSGHHAGTALLMALTKGVLQNEARHSLAHPDRLLQSLNHQLLACSDESSFMTLFFGRIEARPRLLHWSSAGHGPVFCYRADPGKIIEFPPNDIPLGIDPGATYPSPPPFPLRAGDVLLIGTDGLWETRNRQGKMFRTERLRQIIASHAKKSARDLHRLVMERVAAHRQGAPQEDDMTLLLIKVLAVDES